MKMYLNLKRVPRARGVPADRDELKIRRGLMISPTAWAGLAALAERMGYKSKSDLIEAIGRGEIQIQIQSNKEPPQTGGDSAQPQ